MKDGYRSICRECYNARERVRERERYASDSEFRSKKLDRAGSRYKSNTETIKEYARGYARKNRTRRNFLDSKRRKSDPQWAIRTRLASAFSRVISGSVRFSRVFNEEYEAYRVALLCRDTDAYIKWRKNPSEYHVDHIIPCSVYNLSIDDEIKKCFDKRNLRLIPADENISKSGRLDMDLVEYYHINDLLPEGFVTSPMGA